MKCISFEWEENKNQINKVRHGIDFEEAATVFMMTMQLFRHTISDINQSVFVRLRKEQEAVTDVLEIGKIAFLAPFKR